MVLVVLNTHGTANPSVGQDYIYDCWLLNSQEFHWPWYSSGPISIPWSSALAYLVISDLSLLQRLECFVTSSFSLIRARPSSSKQRHICFWSLVLYLIVLKVHVLLVATKLETKFRASHDLNPIGEFHQIFDPWGYREYLESEQSYRHMSNSLIIVRTALTCISLRPPIFITPGYFQRKQLFRW